MTGVAERASASFDPYADAPPASRVRFLYRLNPAHQARGPCTRHGAARLRAGCRDPARLPRARVRDPPRGREVHPAARAHALRGHAPRRRGDRRGVLALDRPVAGRPERGRAAGRIVDTVRRDAADRVRHRAPPRRDHGAVAHLRAQHDRPRPRALDGAAAARAVPHRLHGARCVPLRAAIRARTGRHPPGASRARAPTAAGGPSPTSRAGPATSCRSWRVPSGTPSASPSRWMPAPSAPTRTAPSVTSCRGASATPSSSSCSARSRPCCCGSCSRGACHDGPAPSKSWSPTGSSMRALPGWLAAGRRP